MFLKFWFYLISIFGLMFFLIFFRMQRIDLDYQYNLLHKKTQLELIKNKDLKAMYAQLLSVQNLRLMSKKNNFERANEKKIIFIP